MKITQIFQAVALAGLLACSSAGGASAVTLNLGNGADPGTLDPDLASVDVENRIVGEIFEGLVAEDEHADAIPGQAKSWTVSDDGLVYTFKLRADAKWTDGQPVVAQNFVDGLTAPIRSQNCGDLCLPAVPHQEFGQDQFGRDHRFHATWRQGDRRQDARNHP